MENQQYFLKILKEVLFRIPVPAGITGEKLKEYLQNIKK